MLRSASPYSGSFDQQAKRKYLVIDPTKLQLLAAGLQMVEPLENTDLPNE